MKTAEKIVITGSPGTGKTVIIETLLRRGCICFPEISRTVTLEARAQGIAQLFLEDGLLFSRKLLERRIRQFCEAETYPGKTVFLDRGIPDILAYMDYAGEAYPPSFTEACKKYRYNRVFFLPLWEEIYTTDSERYENFQQATVIDRYLKKTYRTYGYDYIEVPVGNVYQRVDFIMNRLK